MTNSTCPEFPDRIADCPLFVIGHDGRLSTFSCVDHLDQPCRVARGEVTFSKMFDRAHAELFRRVRAHYLPHDALSHAKAGGLS